MAFRWPELSGACMLHLRWMAFVVVLASASVACARQCVVYQPSERGFMLMKSHADCAPHANNVGWYGFCQDEGDSCRENCRADYRSGRTAKELAGLLSLRRRCLAVCDDVEVACTRSPAGGPQ